MKHPLLQLTKARPDEWVPLGWCALYIFCLMSCYYVLRPLRDMMGIAGGVRDLPWLFSATLICMLLLNLPFVALSRRLPRKRFIPISYRFFVVNLVIFSVLLYAASPAQQIIIGRLFFVWVSVFNLFVVSLFWAFVVDIFSAESGKRLFALMSSGATVGAILGSALTAGLARWIPPYGLLIIAAALLEMAILCVRRLAIHAADQPQADRSAERGLGGGLFDGILHTLRSPYLASLCVNMLLFSVTSTILYFQQADFIHHAFQHNSARTTVFAILDLSVNLLTLLVQLLFTARLIARFGVAATLAIIPFLSTLGFGAIALLPSLVVLLAFSSLRRAGNFAIARPTREVLFTVLSREDKYKAKSFIDTAVYRLGDQIGSWSWAGLNTLGLSSPTVSLCVATPLSLLWLANSYWLGRQQQQRAHAQEVAEKIDQRASPHLSP